MTFPKLTGDPRSLSLDALRLERCSWAAELAPCLFPSIIWQNYSNLSQPLAWFLVSAQWKLSGFSQRLFESEAALPWGPAESHTEPSMRAPCLSGSRREVAI